MRSYFTVFLVWMLSVVVVTAGSSSNWNIDQAKANVASTTKKITKSSKDQIKRAREQSNVLKAKARQVRDDARTKASELVAKAKGKSPSIQESTKKRAESILADAKSKAKSFEEKAKKVLANV